MLSFEDLERLDQEMLAERERASAQGPGVWRDRLRSEAIRVMHERVGAPIEAIERDLDEYIATSKADVVTTLEQLVYKQRFLRMAEVAGVAEGT